MDRVVSFFSELGFGAILLLCIGATAAIVGIVYYALRRRLILGKNAPRNGVGTGSARQTIALEKPHAARGIDAPIDQHLASSEVLASLRRRYPNQVSYEHSSEAEFEREVSASLRRKYANQVSYEHSSEAEFERALVSRIMAVPKASPVAQQALEIQRGKMVEKIPREMQVGVREPVEIRLGTPEAKDIMVTIIGSGQVTEHEIDLVETMSIELISPDGAFKVEGASPTTQLVKRDVLKGTRFADFAADFGQWIWYVTPQDRGTHPLSIRVSASVLDSKGTQANAALPDRVIEIEVSVNLARASSSLTKRIATLAASGMVTGLFGAIVGVLSKDYWWPMIAPFFK